MFCSQCGKQAGEVRARFCKSCGAAMPKAYAPPPEAAASPNAPLSPTPGPEDAWPGSAGSSYTDIAPTAAYEQMHAPLADSFARSPVAPSFSDPALAYPQPGRRSAPMAVLLASALAIIITGFGIGYLVVTGLLSG